VIVPRLFEEPLCASSPRALIVGQYPLVLAALARLICGPPLNIKAELSTRSDEAIQRIASEAHELLFCDLRSPPITGVELAARLTQRNSPTRVVVLADEEDAPLLVGSLDCGAAGFFTREASADEFVQGVQAVLAGHCAIGRSLARLALARFAGHQPVQGGLYERLSMAERSIFALVGEAQSTREIAAARGISPKTVRNHLGSIYRKLEVRNRSEAIKWSMRMGRQSQAMGPFPISQPGDGG